MSKKDTADSSPAQANASGSEPIDETAQTPSSESGNVADPSSQQGNGDGGNPNTDLRQELEAVRGERDANREQWLRTEAELDNFRKRMRKEADDLRRYQALALARDLLPALDNLDRAITATEGSGDVESLLQGIRMVAQQFREVFARHSIEPIAAKDQPFDPNLHEAVQQIPSADHPPMTVLEELEPGYKLHDRVIRPSKVLVSSVPPSHASSEGESD